MSRSLPLLLLAVLAGRAAGQDRADELLRAAEARVIRAVKEQGPSVVRIHVSRSDAYHKAPWGTPADPEYPGALGRFDPAAAANKVPADAPDRDRALADIKDHDLSAAAHVPESFGSGFVIDRSGLVVTNYHVIKGATKLYVRVPGAAGSWADVHAGDPRSDLAVLRLLDPPAGLKALELGDGGAVRVGQTVLSLCNPFAPGFRDEAPAVAGHGLIAALRQAPPGAKMDETDLHRATLHQYGTLLQTSADVAPGCSGGVLLDLDGRAVGLTSALVAVTGDRPGGFAIPFDAGTRRILEVLRRGEEVEYGFLGVVLQPPGGFLGGVSLWRVSPGSPAERAGLRSGDLITAINGNPVRKNSDLFLHIGVGLNGGTAKVVVRRGLGSVEVSVKLAKFYYPGPIIAAKRPPARFGLRVDHASILTQRNPFPGFGRATPDGVVIREVLPGGPADAARLQPDKMITHVNGKQVLTPAEYLAAVVRSGRSAKLTVLTSDGRPEEIQLNEK
ncbi:MAG: trypsin-like peptidase domain-containing protein [Gemmataceae bacterium]